MGFHAEHKIAKNIFINQILTYINQDERKMTGTWKEIERNQWLSMDCHWNQNEIYHLWNIFEYLWMLQASSLLGTNTYEHWSKITPKSVPARKHQTLKDCCLNLFDQTVLCQVPALCDVQWQGSHSQWPCFLTNNARPWEQIQENLRLAGLLQGFIDKLPVLSGTLFRTDPCAFCFSPLRVFIFFMGLTFWLSWCPFFCWGLAGRRTRFKSWHKHAAQWRYNEVYTKYNDLAMKPTKTI